jgi:serine/threonine-protein phosphatase 4 regulatory subunit 4
LQRILFLEICKLVLELYSRAFFKEHFFESVLDLTTDPVPNVRLRLCPLLPKLKAIIRMPAERQLLQLLETSVRKFLSSELDRDVRQALEKAVSELDRVTVLMESVRYFYKIYHECSVVGHH